SMSSRVALPQSLTSLPYRSVTSGARMRVTVSPAGNPMGGELAASANWAPSAGRTPSRDAVVTALPVDWPVSTGRVAVSPPSFVAEPVMPPTAAGRIPASAPAAVTPPSPVLDSTGRLIVNVPVISAAGSSYARSIPCSPDQVLAAG